MKPPRMRLLCIRRARAASTPARKKHCAWRVLPLIWKRAAPLGTSLAVTRTDQHFHQRFSAALHLHMRTDAHIAARAIVAAAPTSPRQRVHASYSASHPCTALHLLTVRQSETHHERRSVRLLKREFSVRHREAPTSATASVKTTTSLRAAITAFIPLFSPNESPAGRATHSLPLLAAATPPAGTAHHITPAPSRGRRAGLASDTARAMALRSPVLVWEKAAPPVAEPPLHADIPVSSGGSRCAPPLPRMAPDVVPLLPPAQLQQLARETQRALLLDASLVDRVADDVLRRVDKRLRIERERRGL